MDKVALLAAGDRAALFGETAAIRGISETIIEKDFWVCWCLRRLFGLPPGTSASLVFKGGTSLSKAFGAIRRFSEDIDLSFDRAELGYTGDRDPEKEGISKKQVARLIDSLVGDVEQHIAEKLVPALHDAISEQLGDAASGKWSLEIDANDTQTVNFHYPTALPASDYAGMAYITPRVKLELGARGDPWPTEEKSIRPYAADDFPDFFTSPDTNVTVLSARRTFWEKATALHAEAHRPAESATPHYFSRHYYDLAMLADTDEGRAAMVDFDLLIQVTRHKAIFFRSGWASYETARPGTLRLMPDEFRVKDLRTDYRAMAPMMFDQTPLPFDDILAKIAALQEVINS
ncbi:nucleotidyl transferase AbiEii/AbiGii toxin family protein [Acidomonas methanolica]|uniref:Nucleotidyl transferase AbiEii/AbiGii toxin family protein n=1 Tax=Acidomonas methanolica NBRC 104435 TaxID=1231351 RepID=A0A023D5I5_ACIMT|nr:nucleotidyl transferase AbiEii/AbiGii toxin family protein [Acidomonas methanolica]MBU2655077.1 nucleotidyl transferase AbiEii/AbiGii toxin family protein [Acidomonas methanolica]TCS29487.1 hypothetical protein EDC31_10656 [Acidomonas methanolica]GAJ29329.1 hypothetical protein Amme_059_048 [Acidomonas methanolica NBRC 104435]GBQ45542.1 hypothetical protein AA0498_0076 [Acidomonas methanolica]GEK99093.1 hypothetical protein AME01nite_15920 [Acidomonas methanolica NBRC 104435]